MARHILLDPLVFVNDLDHEEAGRTKIGACRKNSLTSFPANYNFTG